MEHGGGVQLTGEAEGQPGDQRAAEAGADRVGVQIDGLGRDGRAQEILGEGSAAVQDVQPSTEPLRDQAFVLAGLVLSEVDTDRVDVTESRLPEPVQQITAVEAAAEKSDDR